MAGWNGSTRRSRLPSNWPALRTAVMRRDRGICYVCGGPGADTVDHVEQGDDHSMGNLAAIHDRNPPHCHRFKSAAEGHAGLAVQRAKGRHPAERNPGLLPPR
jgi:5-methylcytosine-specific restriction protein A